jgi:hypothetical protein
MDQVFKAAPKTQAWNHGRKQQWNPEEKFIQPIIYLIMWGLSFNISIFRIILKLDNAPLKLYYKPQTLHAENYSKNSEGSTSDHWENNPI